MTISWDSERPLGTVITGAFTLVNPGRGSIQGTSRRIFQGLAGSYELSLRLATLLQDRRWKDWVARRMPAKVGGLCLDVGCGTLLYEERWASQGRSYVGLDLSMEMITVGRAKGLRNVLLVVNGDAEYLPFPDRSFDSVVSCYVAKYVDMFRFAEELARVTKPGGSAALYDFARPRGPRGPFVELYIQGCLRGAGFLLGLARRESAFTFSRLPGIIDGIAWDAQAVKAMEGSGFETVATERLTGGVVFAYCGHRSA